MDSILFSSFVEAYPNHFPRTSVKISIWPKDSGSKQILLEYDKKTSLIWTISGTPDAIKIIFEFNGPLARASLLPES